MRWQGNTQREEQEGIAARRRTVLEGLLAGVSQADLARSLGVSPATITIDVAAIRAAWKEDQTAGYEELVNQQRERLERLNRSCWQRATQGNVDAIKAALAVHDRFCKLLGLDQPEKHHVQVDDHSIDEVRTRLEAIAAAMSTAEANGEGETTTDE